VGTAGDSSRTTPVDVDFGVLQVSAASVSSSRIISRYVGDGTFIGVLVIIIIIIITTT